MKIAEIERLSDLPALLNKELAVSDWVTMSQERINQFAEATGDFQWIHIDAERAKHSPFGSTIAHGFLTLSIIAGLSSQTIKYKSVRMGVNYGVNKVRFMNPVKSGARVRARYTPVGTEPIPGGVQVMMQVTIEIDGEEKPACVAETISRVYE